MPFNNAIDSSGLSENNLAFSEKTKFLFTQLLLNTTPIFKSKPCCQLSLQKSPQTLPRQNSTHKQVLWAAQTWVHPKITPGFDCTQEVPAEPTSPAGVSVRATLTPAPSTLPFSEQDYQGIRNANIKSKMQQERGVSTQESKE